MSRHNLNSELEDVAASADGLKIAGSGGKVGFFGDTPVSQPTALTNVAGAALTAAAGSALTAALTTLVPNAPGTPDYALQALTNSSPFGFKTADEGETSLKLLAALQVNMAEMLILEASDRVRIAELATRGVSDRLRIGELETKLTALGALA